MKTLFEHTFCERYGRLRIRVGVRVKKAIMSFYALIKSFLEIKVYCTLCKVHLSMLYTLESHPYTKAPAICMLALDSRSRGDTRQ